MMRMADKAIELYSLENLERFYVQKTEIVKAINGINLEICQGDFIIILGPSGSGKTTLLNLLSGLDKSTGGRIVFNQKDFTQLTDSDLCECRLFEIGIIFQFYNMHPSFTAQENIEFPMMIAGIPILKRQERASELLHNIDLFHKKDNFPSELSGGEKQRIGIARALANDPLVIIADEPTGDLDSENAKNVIKWLVTINKQGKTIIMVTHDESLITEDMRILYLVDGKIVKNI